MTHIVIGTDALLTLKGQRGSPVDVIVAEVPRDWRKPNSKHWEAIRDMGVAEVHLRYPEPDILILRASKSTTIIDGPNRYQVNLDDFTWLPNSMMGWWLEWMGEGTQTLHTYKYAKPKKLSRVPVVNDVNREPNRYAPKKKHDPVPKVITNLVYTPHSIVDPSGSVCMGTQVWALKGHTGDLAGMAKFFRSAAYKEFSASIEWNKSMNPVALKQLKDNWWRSL